MKIVKYFNTVNLIKLLVFVLLFSTTAPHFAQASPKNSNVPQNNLIAESEELTDDDELVIETRAIPVIIANTVIRYLAKKTLQAAGAKFGKRVVVNLLGNGIKNYSDVWKGFKSYRGTIKTNGKSGKNKQYYEWDNTHSDIEVYDHKGNHLGSMDPFDGNMYKPAVKGRNIKDKL